MFAIFFLLLSFSLAVVSSDTDSDVTEHSTHILEVALQSACTLRKLYRQYVALHGHTRPPHQERIRLQFFKQEIKEILALRANPNIKWEAGINLMADMSEAERGQLKGFNPNVTVTEDSLDFMKRHESVLSTTSLPDSFDDWRIRGLIGKAPDQLKNDCWAHAAIVPVEAEIALYKGEFVRMSVQELYDCSYPSTHPIDELGGNPLDAWRYIAKSGRIGRWKDSPETKKREMKTCAGRYDGNKNAIEGYQMESVVQVKDEANLLKLIKCTSPMVVGVDTVGSHLGKYKGKGLFNAIKCNPVGDHTLVVVGYTPEALIIRNSWGKNFGLKGYVMWDRSGETCCMYHNAFSAFLIKKPTKRSKRGDPLWSDTPPESCINWAAVPKVRDGEEYF